ANSMLALRARAREPALRPRALFPPSRNTRHCQRGEVLFAMVFGAPAEQKYGAPYLLAHRGDLHAALASAVPDEVIRLDHRLVGFEQGPHGVRLWFDNGATGEADVLIGADGVNSVVRTA